MILVIRWRETRKKKCFLGYRNTKLMVYYESLETEKNYKRYLAMEKKVMVPASSPDKGFFISHSLSQWQSTKNVPRASKSSSTDRHGNKFSSIVLSTSPSCWGDALQDFVTILSQRLKEDDSEGESRQTPTIFCGHPRNVESSNAEKTSASWTTCDVSLFYNVK